MEHVQEFVEIISGIPDNKVFRIYQLLVLSIPERCVNGGFPQENKEEVKCQESKENPVGDSNTNASVLSVYGHVAFSSSRVGGGELNVSQRVDSLIYDN